MVKKSKEKLKYLNDLEKCTLQRTEKSLSLSSKQISKSKFKKKKLKKLKNTTTMKTKKSEMVSNQNRKFNTSDSLGPTNKKKSPKDLSLRERLMNQLSASRFRYINEELYRSDSKTAGDMFRSDPESFSAYHDGFQRQVSRWPVNPVDKTIEYIQQKGSHLIVADFGCGDAKISRSVENQVHSFDLVALNDHVTVADMAKVPLKDHSVDIVIFCLSLMGTNIADFIREASRVLKSGGTLLIAEVASRFYSLEDFQMKLRQMGFACKEMDTTTSKMFVWLRLQKVKNISKDKPVPDIELKPCVYNKRKSTKNN